MSINHAIWQNQLRWNKFRITYGKYKLFIRYNVLIKSKKLGVFRLGHHRLSKLELMDELSNKGYSNKEISNYLNQHNIKTPKGLDYYPKLVWVTLFKYRRRQQRYFNDEVMRVVETLVVVPFKIFNELKK